MKYTSRGLRRRGDTDKWEVILTHKDPMTGESLTTYHTVTAKTKRAAERAREELIVQLELQGGAIGTNMTVQEYMDAFLLYKQYSGTVEPSTIKGYRSDTKYITKYIGDVKLSDLKIPVVNKWMADATKDGYAPKTITKSFRLLKQALKYAQSQDLLTKNPCDFCKMNGFDCTFHDLRHTFATMVIGNGIDVRTVASYLGHANVSMTLDIYADVDPEVKMSAVDKIEACFDSYNGSRTMPAVNPFDGNFAVAVESVPFSKEQLEFVLKALEQNMRMPLEERGHGIGAGFRF